MAYCSISQSGSSPCACFLGADLGVAQIGKEDVVHLQVAAADIVEALDRLLVGLGEVRKQQLEIVAIGLVADIVIGDAEMAAARARDRNLGHHAGIGGHELEMLEHWVVGREIHRAGNGREDRPGIGALEVVSGGDIALDELEALELLHEIIVPERAADFAVGLRHILRKRREVTTLLATVTGVDVAGKAVVLEDGGRVPYDSLIIATGARHAYFGHDDWEQFAPGLKTLEDATTIRRKLLLAFEAAERETDPDKRRALLTFVIIGAGPTGVELAGAIIELARVTLKGEFRSIAPGEARVVLIEGGKRVLANFKPELSDYTLKALRDLGVEVMLGEPVTTIDADGVVYGGKRLDADAIIWAAGVQASPAAKWLGRRAGPGRTGQGRGGPTVPGHPEIFVIGDTATITMPDGKPVPGVGDGAKQGGKHAARVIRARLDACATPAVPLQACGRPCDDRQAGGGDRLRLDPAQGLDRPGGSGGWPISTS